jgi:arylsulfatase A
MKSNIPIALFASLAAVSYAQTSKGKAHPNIIFILADDLGYGDLSCYGQKKFTTPNIDRLAKQGMLFTQHYAGCTVSAPSRCSLLTGKHTGHTEIRGNKEWKPEGQWPLSAKALTIPELLKKRGYVNGAFGKWGLGYIDTEGDPNSQGFDEFYGYNCQSLAHNYYPDHLWHNHEKVILRQNGDGKTGGYSADLIHRAAISFIETNRNKPFFVYYATTIPHAELAAKDDYLKQFKGKYEPEKSFQGTDSGPSFRLGPYGSQLYSHAAFAAMIKELDDYVGEIVAKIRELGLEKNTIFIFSSDNGPHQEGGGDPDYFNSNGELRGYKRDLYEGGIRTPLLVKWQGIIKAGSVSNHISAFWDILPTLAEITGAEIPAATDGISILPALLGKKKQAEHDYLFWEFHEQGGKMAVRKGKWKAIMLNVDKNAENSIELYDLSQDTGETRDIASSNPEIVSNLRNIMKQAHTPSEVFPFGTEASK